jgi:hypothetical protein
LTPALTVDPFQLHFQDLRAHTRAIYCIDFVCIARTRHDDREILPGFGLLESEERSFFEKPGRQQNRDRSCGSSGLGPRVYCIYVHPSSDMGHSHRGPFRILILQIWGFALAQCGEFKINLKMGLFPSCHRQSSGQGPTSPILIVCDSPSSENPCAAFFSSASILSPSAD